MSKIKMIGCGGAGINITKEVSAKVNALGDGFSGIDTMFIDTSVSTHTDVFLVENIDRSKSEINGSGGLRATNAKAIQVGVKKFIDEYKISYKIGEYYFVTFSASGGSGSIAAVLLIKELMDMNIPVVAVVAGDTSNGLYAQNTLDTLASLNAIAKTPLAISYVNNSVYGDNVKLALEQANSDIFNIMAGMALFLSGQNKDIDDQDMENIINMNNYNPKLNIKKGLYGIDIFNNELILKDHYIPIISRTLCTEECELEHRLKFLHNKVGVMKSDNAKKYYGSAAPVHMLTYANIFSVEKKVIEKVIADYNSIMNSIVVDTVESDNSELDEDLGIVL
jgi:hypothetical protein